MELKFSVLIIFLLLIPTSMAYTTSNGIEDGDTVVVDYVGTFENGTEFDSGDDIQFVVDEGHLIEGFYNGLLGMKINEQKIITVSPSQGYTDPDHFLYGETTIYDVFIEEIICCIRNGTSSNNLVSSDTNRSSSFVIPQISFNIVVDCQVKDYWEQ